MLRAQAMTKGIMMSIIICRYCPSVRGQEVSFCGKFRLTSSQSEYMQ